MFYKLGAEQPEYVPDFVAETDHFVLMVETKARNELEAADVVAKAEAGAVWCAHASDHAANVGAKPWKYLLVPHEQVTEDKTLKDFLSFAKAAPK
jgi:type III restriction enzyme